MVDASIMRVTQLLSGNYAYGVAPFQRPFSWTAEQAARLYDDVHFALENEEKADADSLGYFLGSIILQRNAPGAAQATIVDGQQRLTVLTILLAVIRDLLGAGHNDTLSNAIWRPRGLNGAESAPRLRLRETDQPFLEKAVLTPGAAPHVGSAEAQGEAAELIKAATLRLLEEIGTPARDYLARLAMYVLDRCYVVCITSSNLADAYLLFRSVNTPGQPLSALDMLKSELIGQRSDDSGTAHALAREWDEIEGDIGRDEMMVLLRAVLAGFVPEADTLDDEILVQRAITRPTLRPYVRTKLPEIFAAYRRIHIAGGRGDIAGDTVALALARLNLLPFSDWKECAMAWFTAGGAPLDGPHFLKRLEAVGWTLAINGATPRQLRAKFGAIAAAARAKQNMFAAASALAIPPTDLGRAKNALMGPIQPRAPYLKALLERLNADMLNPAIQVQYTEQTTIEHILPRRPAANSEWLGLFPDASRRERTTLLLGNHALLTRPINSAIKNAPFAQKKQKIVEHEGADLFAITLDALQAERWNETTIMRRQEKLVQRMFAILEAR